MHRVYLGLGSNIEPEKHISAAIAECRKLLRILKISNVYRGPALGFSGPDFLNLVVAAETDLELEALISRLRQVEYAYGRPPCAEKFSSRSLDIDILTYDECRGVHHGITLPRPEITKCAFVLRPFAEIAPAFVLPGSEFTLKEIWETHVLQAQPLELVPWPGPSEAAASHKTASA